ncbi:hypothetical protein [Croceitalea rosinachiae]|uniref:LTXXQ motif family protein n=1 Tax=Croceitalea rosinachiae TaxID=3075596 RepID=A0ABU3AAG4_9FLAO|nr:hypothetical protein [Croceitalea sp. F388]MDT0606800.1 hypothetical protein [Croceitalea sp. F388]
MKTRLVVAIAILSAQLISGQKINAKEIADYQTNLMVERLDLNQEQKKKITEHNLKFSKKQAALMNREGSMFGKIGDIKKIKKERNAELEIILNKEQMEVFEDEIEPEIRKHMRKKMME